MKRYLKDFINFKRSTKVAHLELLPQPKLPLARLVAEVELAFGEGLVQVDHEAVVLFWPGSQTLLVQDSKDSLAVRNGVLNTLLLYVTSYGSYNVCVELYVCSIGM